MLGLEGLVVAETRLSSVDGEKGELVVCGLSLEQLAARNFEEAFHTLLDTSVELASLRCQVFPKLRLILPLLTGDREPSAALRLGLASLPSNISAEELVAAFPLLLAGARHGSNLQAPDPKLSQVEDFMRLFFGERQAADRVRALNTYLVTVSEHGMNASTFACRVVASTGAKPLESALAGLAALSGPLHGGAPGPVLDLLDELREVDDREVHLREKLRRGERLMGFGHRIYRRRDPRAEVLQGAVQSLRPSAELRFAQQVEVLAQKVLQDWKPDRPLKTNVEFYTALLLHELGFERSWFTALFAMGRVMGWMAHFQEQRALGKLMRPQSRYIGALPQGAKL